MSSTPKPRKGIAEKLKLEPRPGDDLWLTAFNVDVLAFDTAEDRDEAARRLEAWDEAKVMQEALPLSPDVIATRLLNDDRVHPEEAKALARAWLRKLDSAQKWKCEECGREFFNADGNCEKCESGMALDSESEGA